jgi:hypothetical protein
MEYFYNRHFDRCINHFRKYSQYLGLQIPPDFPVKLVAQPLAKWMGSISRILLNIRRYLHGGAILILPNPSPADLAVKYPIHYASLDMALLENAVCFFADSYCCEQIQQAAMKEQPDSETVRVPSRPHYIHQLLEELNKKSLAEIAGCVGFIAALSCIDGLIVLDGDLVVHSFGTIITVEDKIDDFFIAGDSLATPSLLRKQDPKVYGPRHQSMMRFCSKYPDSLGYVISEDGYIRAMTKIDGHLVMWENIQPEAQTMHQGKPLH